MYIYGGDGGGGGGRGARGGGSGGGGGGSNRHPCAACILEGKSCDESCELAPYFPASRSYEFCIADSYYGIDNIVRILNSVEPYRRRAAAELILFEGNVRFNNLMPIIRSLELQLRDLQFQLEAARQQLASFRGIQQQRQQLDNSVPSSSSTVPPPLEPE